MDRGRKSAFSVWAPHTQNLGSDLSRLALNPMAPGGSRVLTAFLVTGPDGYLGRTPWWARTSVPGAAGPGQGRSAPHRSGTAVVQGAPEN